MTQVTTFNFTASPWPGSSALPAINQMILALLDDNAGATAPPNPVPGMRWRDTSVNPSILYIRNAANNAWVMFDPIAAGLGVDTLATASTMNANNTSRIGRVASGAAGNPLAGEAFRYIHLPGAATSAASQIAIGETSGRMFWRTKISNTWGAWNEVPRQAPGLVLLARQVFTGQATADFTQFDAALYSSYRFVFENVRPATNGATLAARTSSNGGGAYDAGASDYAHVNLSVASNAPTTVAGGGAATTNAIALAGFVGNGSGQDGVSGEVLVSGPGDARRTQIDFSFSSFNNAGNFGTVKGSGARLASTATNAIRFLFDAGNIASGAIAMYGLRNS